MVSPWDLSATVCTMSDEQRHPLPPGAPVLYTIPEVCEILRVSRTTLWRLTRAGDLYAVKVGQSMRYPRETIDAHMLGERYNPRAGSPEQHADESTWPPTPSLLDPATTSGATP